jgi:hypothetical protein
MMSCWYWLRTLNSGLLTWQWRVLDRQSEPKGQQHIIFRDWEAIRVIRETWYKIFIGLIQEIIKVLGVPEVGHKVREKSLESPPFVGSDIEGGRTIMDTPSKI